MMNTKQSSEWDFEVAQIPMEYEFKGKKVQSERFANIRMDNGEEVGWSSERYAIVQNRDLVQRAESKFAERGIEWNNREIMTTGKHGTKFRAIYDLSGDMFKSEVPQVGDVMGYRLILQNSFDLSRRVSFALGLLRLVCANGMQTMEKDVNMLAKHSKHLDLDNLITDKVLNNSFAKLKKSTDVFAKLAGIQVEQEQGLNILQNMTGSQNKIPSEKIRERVAHIWNNPTQLRSDDRSYNLYNLYNSITQHLTDEYEDRFDYANRIGGKVLEEFSLAADNSNRLKQLTATPKVVEVPQSEEVVVTE